MEEEIKRFTERLYNETFGNGQGTLDKFDWEDIATVIGETAHHFVNWQKERQLQWKPSKEQMKAFKNSVEHIPNAYYNDMWELYEQLKKLM